MNLIQKVLFVILLCSSSFAFGQLTEDPDDRRGKGKDPLRTQTVDGKPLPFGQRLRFGGGITGFQFGNPFSLGVSPVVAYQASEHLIVGIGVNYTYSRYKYPYYNPPFTINQYGGRGFAMYEFIPSILPNLYLHGEIQTNVYQLKGDQNTGGLSGTVTAPLIGLTYMQPISRRFGVNITALYNLSYNPSDPISYYVYNGTPFVLRLSFF